MNGLFLRRRQHFIYGDREPSQKDAGGLRPGAEFTMDLVPLALQRQDPNPSLLRIDDPVLWNPGTRVIEPFLLQIPCPILWIRTHHFHYHVDAVPIFLLAALSLLGFHL